MIESKSFEITIDEVGKKGKVCICEWSKYFGSWVRFGEEGLRCLLEGVEFCKKAPEGN